MTTVLTITSATSGWVKTAVCQMAHLKLATAALRMQNAAPTSVRAAATTDSACAPTIATVPVPTNGAANVRGGTYAWLPSQHYRAVQHANATASAPPTGAKDQAIPDVVSAGSTAIAEIPTNGDAATAQRALTYVKRARTAPHLAPAPCPP